MMLAAFQGVGDLFFLLLALLDDLFIKFTLMIRRIPLLSVATSITDTPEAEV